MAVDTNTGGSTMLADPELKLQNMKAVAGEEGRFKESEYLDCDDDGKFPRRNGTWVTASAHIITAVIGSGVLGLGWAISQMGWVFGPIVLLLFGLITMYTTGLLSEAYRTGDEYSGSRNPTYMHAVRAHLGPWNQFFCALIQYVKLFAAGVGYTVTGSLCLVAAKRAVCFHEHGESHKAPCSFDNVPWMIMFGALQLVFSQIPDFGHLWWLSYLAALMSFGYSFIGLGMAIGKTTQHGHKDYGTVWGANTSKSEAKAVWNVFVALGNACFSFNFSPILIEIADTMAQPPSESRSLKKATRVSIAISIAFYMSVGCMSYAGFGNSSPGNLLTGFGFFNPYWLVAMANIFVWVHLIGGYQVYLQPFMGFIESRIQLLFPNVPYLYNELSFNCPGLGRVPVSVLRLVSRSIIVCLTTVIAIILPFFNAIVGLLGAICFFPLTVYFPCQMSLVRYGNPRFSTRWILLNLLCIFALLISLCAGIGSIENIIENLKTYKPFHSVSSSIASG